LLDQNNCVVIGTGTTSTTIGEPIGVKDIHLPYIVPTITVESDPINPDHYKKGSMETIDQMLTLFGSAKVKAFCELNAFKYRMRAGHKSKNIEEDIKKAMWYEDKMRDVI
jgi:hypothetical protein